MTAFENTRFPRFLRPADLKATRRNNRQVQGQRILKGAANVLLALILGLAASWIFQRTQSDRRFAIRSIEIEGGHAVTQRDVGRKLASYKGANLFKLDIALVQSEISKLPWVERAAIEKELPNTLKIRLFQREPAALLLRNGTLHYVDRLGKTFARLSPVFGNDDLPVIRESDTKQITAAAGFLSAFRRTRPDLYERISEITALVGGGFSIFDREMGTTLYVGDDGSADKWGAMIQLAGAEDYEKGSLTYADLRFGQRLIVKPLPAEPRTVPLAVPVRAVAPTVGAAPRGGAIAPAGVIAIKRQQQAFPPSRPEALSTKPRSRLNSPGTTH